MSSLRHTAETYLQEVNSDAEQEFISDINDIPARFESSGHGKNHISDPSLVHTRMLLESHFEAAQQTLLSQQRQALQLLQQSCMDVVGNHHRTIGLAWVDQPITLPGSPLQIPTPTKSMQVPRAPSDFGPTKLEMIHTETLMDVPTHFEEDNLEFSKTGRLSENRPTQIQPVFQSEKPTARDTFQENGKVVHIQRRQSFNFSQFKERRKATLRVQDAALDEIKKNKGHVDGTDAEYNATLAHAVFADAAAMKAKVKEHIMKPEYNVVQFYKTDGCPQQIARSSLFDHITLFVIGLNALWIWIDTDYNDSPTLLDAHPLFQVGENLFCLYFAFEIVIRFLAFKQKRDCLRDAWFVFDGGLVVTMVVETWLLNLVVWIFGTGGSTNVGSATILRLVRLLRLTRMARLARLLRAMPELMILVKGITVAARSVLFTLLLLFVILYVFAIAFRQLCSESHLKNSHFKSVPESMNTLLLKGVLPDQSTLISDLGDANYFFGAVVLFFVLLSSLTIINMLVGVLCEVVSVVSSVEKEQMALNFVKNKVLSLVHESGLGKDESVRISRDEFQQLLLLPEGARVIQEVGVDVVMLVDLLDDIFNEDAALSFADLMELVLQLRGTNTATVRDVVDLRKFLTQLVTDSHDHVIETLMKMFAHTVYQIVEQIIEEKLKKS